MDEHNGRNRQEYFCLVDVAATQFFFAKVETTAKQWQHVATGVSLWSIQPKIEP